MEFKCECCNYSTIFKSNYSKHIKSKKHILIDTKCTPVIGEKKSTSIMENHQLKVNPSSTQSQQDTTAAYSCKYCEQVFKFKQSMYRHIKYTCKSKDEDLKELVRLNLKLDDEKKEREMERKEFQKQLQTQAKQIEKLTGKLKIHGSFNNNTINNYTLLFGRDTDLAQLSQEDYRRCVKHLIEKVQFNPSNPENMNLYISNMKDKYLMLYDGDNWNLANKVDELDRLYEEKGNPLIVKETE